MLDQYREAVLVDFEFSQPDGETVQRIDCVVVHHLKAGTTTRLWARDSTRFHTANPTFFPCPPWQEVHSSICPG